MLDEGIVFGPDAQEGNVTVENVSSETVMFKVKTTNPEKFRVSPPAGLIRPNQLERITVSLVHGGQRVEANSVRDKFLIMCKPLEEGLKNDAVPIDQIHKEFKQASSADIEQHRIRCIYPTNASPDGTFPMAQVEGDARAVFRNGSSTMRFSTMSDDPRGRSSNQVGVQQRCVCECHSLSICFQISDLHETIQRLERKVSRVQTLQFVLLAIIFLLIAVVAVYLPRFEVASSLADLSQQAQEHTLPGKGI